MPRYDNFIPGIYIFYFLFSLQVVITILDVNDNPPNISATEDTIFREETSTLNVVYYTFTAFDIDTNDSISFEIIGGNVGNRFTLDALQLSDFSYTINVMNTKIIDFNTQQSYNLTILATDSGYPSLSTNLSLTIQLLDIINKRPFFPQTFNGTILENSPADGFVGQVFAFDDDTYSSGDVLTYR